MLEPNHQYLAELVVRSRRQDAEAFAELYALTYHKVYSYALRYLKDEYLAQDALQEVYLAAYCNMDRLKDPAMFIAWLNRISFHVCYDLQRRQSRYPYWGSPELLKFVREEHPDSDPEALALHASELLHLRQALDELPSFQREALVMRYYHGMKLEEIAHAMKLSRSTVKRYIAAGKTRLARKLQG